MWVLGDDVIDDGVTDLAPTFGGTIDARVRFGPAKMQRHAGRDEGRGRTASAFASEPAQGGERIQDGRLRRVNPRRLIICV